MKLAHTTIYGDNLKLKKLADGIFHLQGSRHGGVAISKEEVSKVDFLQKLSAINLEPFMHCDNPDFLYFEDHLMVNILLSLFPLELVKKLCGSKDPQAVQENSRQILKNHFPVYFEAMFKETLSADESMGIAEAMFYNDYQDYTILFTGELKNIDSKEYAYLTSVEVKDAEVYGPLSKRNVIYLNAGHYNELISPNIEVVFFPTNNMKMHLVKTKDLAPLLVNPLQAA